MRDGNVCPETGECDCVRCSGEYCDRHFNDPCECDVVARHWAQLEDTMEVRTVTNVERLLGQLQHLEGCEVRMAPGRCTCGLRSLRRAVLGEFSHDPNQTPIGKLRRRLHAAYVECANTNATPAALAYETATEWCVLAEGECREHGISVLEFLDRVESELAQEPHHADLVAEAGRLMFASPKTEAERASV